MLPTQKENRKDKVSTIHLLQAINELRDRSGESQVRHNDFHARVADELDGDHYETFVVQNLNKTQSTYFLLSFDQAKLVAMRESKSVRRQVLDRIKALEARRQIPQTFAEALRLAADQQEIIQQQAAQIEQQRPAVEFVDKYVESTGNMGFRQVAKLLNINERKFRKFLVDNRIMYQLGGDWVAYAPHIAAGRFVTKTGTNTHNDHAYSGALFTPKGVQWVAGLIESI